MSESKVLLEVDGDVGVVTLNDPGALNAVSIDMLEDLNGVLDQIDAAGTDIRCVVLTGAGRGFCAGANLTDGRMDQSGPRDSGEALDKYYHPVFRRLKHLDKPLVTAVNGPAAGVGMSFALMGDLILAADSAYFLQAFRRIGLVPDGGSTYMLPRLIGVARAKELSLLGEKLPAPKALEWGLINRVVPADNLMDEALTLAHDLAKGPTVALGMIRNLYWDSLNASYEEQLIAERLSQKIAGNTEDFREGVRAFLEKRPAEFKGK